MILSFHKLKIATMKRAPRSFLALEQELAEKESHLEAAEQEGRDLIFPLPSSQAQKEEAKGQRKNKLKADSW